MSRPVLNTTTSQQPLRASATHTSGFTDASAGEDGEGGDYPPEDPAAAFSTRTGSWFRKEDLGLFLLQSTIISVCSVVLSLGLSGVVQVSDGRFPFNQSGVAFAIGIAVQVALIAPLELARRVSQVWFWKRLMTKGESFRSLVTTWSVIYSNSYRGAEDLFRGLGPISAFLMAVYLVEVVILGAIGSLYQTQEVTTLKASGTLPLYRPYQSTAVTSEFAFEANAAASEAFFNFAKLYDPTSVQGTDPAESCTPWNMSSVTGSVASCSSVLTHPLTVPSVTFAGHTKPNPMTWTTLAEGDVVKSRATEIFTSVSCEQSDAIFTDADPFDDSANNLHLLFNTTDGQTVSGTDPLYAVQLAYFETPQVQVITLGTGAILEDPVFDENGAMLFVMMAWNFPSYPGWTEMKIRAYSTAWSDHPIEVRTVGVALCRASVALGTTNAEYTVLQSSPSTVVKLDKTARDEDTPKLYSMDNTVNIFGPSMGIMIVATLYIFTCDFLTCQPSGTDPPYFVTTIGLLGSEILPNGTTVYTPDLQNVTQGMSRLIARILPAFTTSEYNSSDMASALTTTFAEVWEKESTAQIFTTPACNVILAIGIACAGTLILLHVVQTVGRGAWRLDRSAIWTTSSVYLLLQALPSVAGGGILPNVTRSEWRAAGLDQLRDAANAVNVKGNIDARGKMRLKMTGKDGNTLGRRVAGKAGGKLEGTKGPTVDASKSIKVASLEEEQQLPDLL